MQMSLLTRPALQMCHIWQVSEEADIDVSMKDNLQCSIAEATSTTLRRTYGAAAIFMTLVTQLPGLRHQSPQIGINSGACS
jgi:hypothetical protein